MIKRFRDLIMEVVAQPSPGPGKSTGKRNSPKPENLGKRVVKHG